MLKLFAKLFGRRRPRYYLRDIPSMEIPWDGVPMPIKRTRLT